MVVKVKKVNNLFKEKVLTKKKLKTSFRKKQPNLLNEKDSVTVAIVEDYIDLFCLE